MIICDANLFRIAYAAVSTEETRYYLNGVFIEPHHAQGVTMTATNGHVFLTIHDKTGSMGGLSPVIVKIPPKLLKECKPTSKRCDTGHRTMTVEANGLVTVYFADRTKDDYSLTPSTEVGRFAGAIIDGTFPDYRRVIPVVKERGTEDTYSAKYIAMLADVAMQLSDSDYAPMSISSPGIGSPAIVNFDKNDHAFGVIMPIRRASDVIMPDWYLQQEPEAEAVAEVEAEAA